ncbi:MAG: hypothetical protein HY365_02070 [Candidatus Aenigmarchaeota archaeon]|nr:hypothetical protein [Candidatus Aenigmarchaeota archaeon]
MKVFKTKVDTKGRISLPLGARSVADMTSGDEIILELSGNREITLTPVSIKQGNAEVSAKFTDFSMGLRKTVHVLCSYKADIIKSESSRDGTWKALVYLPEETANGLRKKLESIREIEQVRVSE